MYNIYDYNNSDIYNLQRMCKENLFVNQPLQQIIDKNLQFVKKPHNDMKMYADKTIQYDSNKDHVKIRSNELLSALLVSKKIDQQNILAMINCIDLSLCKGLEITYGSNLHLILFQNTNSDVLNNPNYDYFSINYACVEIGVRTSAKAEKSQKVLNNVKYTLNGVIITLFGLIAASYYIAL